MILHYAHLCAAAGGVDAFLIGSELRGITQVRSGASSYPAVAELVDLAADVRVDPRVGHQAQLRRRLVGVLRAPPAGRLGRRLLPPRPALGGRRRSTSSASTTTCRSPTGATGSTISTPRAPTRSPTSTTCAATSRAARASTGSTPAPPTARRRCARRSPTAPHGKPWVFRYKDIRSWWSNQHRNRPGGVESGATTAWVAGEQADPLHRDRLPGGRPRAEPAERLLRPEVGRELPAVLLPRLARRRRAAALPRGGARLLGRAGEQPDLGRLLAAG